MRESEFCTSLIPVLVLACSIGHAAAQSDPRGPVVNPGMSPRVVSDGVDAAGYRFHPRQTQPWQGSWIWLDTSAKSPVAAWFRKEVTLAGAPQSVQARISADAVYRLWINGQLVSRGPADHGNDITAQPRWSHRWLYDARDLTPFFRKGHNVIAAEVFSTGHPIFSLGKPGFTFEAEIQSGSNRTTVTTGPDWLCTTAQAFTLVDVKDREPYFRYDAALEPAGWRLAGFDDSKWARATKIDSAWGVLSASEIPPRMETIYPPSGIATASETVTAPAQGLREGGAVRLSGDGRFSVDYDRVLSAYVGLRITGPAGTEIVIQPNELKEPGFHRMTSLILGGGTTYWEFPMMDSFSRLNIEVRHATGPVVFEDIRASFISYPVTYRGAFESSDPELNRLWKALRWGTQLCMQNHHLDSPHHQEPISDPGDYLIEAVQNYYAFGEPWLARQDLRKFGLLLHHSGYINFHTSYSLLWLQMLVDYYDYTGDEALLRELAPTVHGLLDKFTTWRGRNGLISEAPTYMFLDWVEINGIGGHHPPAVIGQGYMTAFYYRGLADGQRIARLLGDTGRASRYGALRESVSAAFERELWNPEQGRYRDGKPFQTSVAPHEYLPADTQMETFSAQVNALAVLYDLAPKTRQKSLMTRIMEDKPLNVQPYFMHFVFDALAHAGLFAQYAVPQMHRWQIHPSTGTIREMWTSGDFSHGWGGTPLIQMSARILGVTPATPGFDKVAIRPQPCGLTWARGTVPTRRGPVEVSWRRSDSEFVVHVNLPTGTSAELVPPVEHAVVMIDGKRWRGLNAEAGVPVGGGEHEIVVTAGRK
jgi:hypothetical protein